jgi:hypothetical protein
MRRLLLLVVLSGLLWPLTALAFDIGLVPLHSVNEQVNKEYGKNISLHGTPQQIKNLRKWIAQIASIPKGLDTLIQIQNSGHKLFIFHSTYAMVSSGRTSAPVSQNLINGVGESVDIHFNANIPDQGSHRVMDTAGHPIEYTAAQNLYHELAHALHMMKGSWRYFKSERQAIEEENIFRQQLARQQQKPYHERVYVGGIPICPSTDQRPDESWDQKLICNKSSP